MVELYRNVRDEPRLRSCACFKRERGDGVTAEWLRYCRDNRG